MNVNTNRFSKEPKVASASEDLGDLQPGTKYIIFTFAAQAPGKGWSTLPTNTLSGEGDCL